MRLDTDLLLAINGHRNQWLDVLMWFLTEWGLYAYPLGLTLLLLHPKRRELARSVRDGWLAFLFSLFVSETLLKPIIARPRPTSDAELLAQLTVIGRVPTSPGFPSGTATACFAGAVWIWLRFGKGAGLPALLFAALVSYSRAYAGVHWPTDLLAGALVGAACAFGVDRFTRWASVSSVSA